MDDYEVSDAPRMTVNLKRLTRVLAKQWTEVSPEELYCQKVGVKNRELPWGILSEGMICV